MTDLPTIPEHLRPEDGRFGSGPTKVRTEALRALADTGAELLGTSHRKSRVRDQVQRLQEGLAALLGAPDDYEVLVANGGATAFWDMATHGLVRERSRHYVFGEFSEKFSRSTRAAPWLAEPEMVEAPHGSRPAVGPSEVADVHAMTHNETSTGVVMDLRRPDDDALVLVDGTSGAGGVPVDLRETDVYYLSPQKGLAAEGGLLLAMCSPAAVERIGRIAAERHVPPFLDLTIALDNSRKHQTYNTPAVASVFLAAEEVEWLNERGGLSWAVEGCRSKAEHLYGWAEQAAYAEPFVDDPAARSPVVATVDLDGVDADAVNRVLRANGILDTDGYRKLGRNQLRVGMFPAVTQADVEAYTACVDWVVERLA